MAMPVYYVLDADDAVWRRRDGKTYRDGGDPDEILTRTGWRPLIGQTTVSANHDPPIAVRPNFADPEVVLTRTVIVSESEAMEVAKSLRLPTVGW